PQELNPKPHPAIEDEKIAPVLGKLESFSLIDYKQENQFTLIGLLNPAKIRHLQLGELFQESATWTFLKALKLAYPQLSAALASLIVKPNPKLSNFEKTQRADKPVYGNDLWGIPLEYHEQLKELRKESLVASRFQDHLKETRYWHKIFRRTHPSKYRNLEAERQFWNERYGGEYPFPADTFQGGR